MGVGISLTAEELLTGEKRAYKGKSLVSHDFLHFLPHRSTAESPCNSGAFGLFLYF